MADDELDAVADELVGDRHALLRIGDVVADGQHDLLAEMPPAALMSSARLLGAVLSCAPKAAFGPVSGPATPILIWACAAPANAKAGGERDAGQPMRFLHERLPVVSGRLESSASADQAASWPRIMPVFCGFVTWIHAGLAVAVARSAS